MMKVIKRYGALGILFPAIVLASCGKDGLSSTGRDTDNRETETTVTFQLGVPGGSEVEYGRSARAVPGDEEENKVGNLKIHDFRIRTMTEGGSKDTLFAGTYPLEESTESVPPTGSFTNSAGTITARISLAAKVNDEHIFVFVANEGLTRFDSIAQVDTIAMEELGKIRIDRLRKTPSTRLLKKGESSDVLMKGGAVMTVSSILTVTEGMVSSGRITINDLRLQRIVARVDVEDHMDVAYNFKLVSVGARNAAPEGYLSERGSDNARTASLWEEKYFGMELAQNNGMSREETARPYKYRKALYLYESNSSNLPVLVVKYTLNGSPGTKEVEMKDYTTGQYFDIRRNWIYTLKIGDITDGALSVRITGSRAEDNNKE